MAIIGKCDKCGRVTMNYECVSCLRAEAERGSMATMGIKKTGMAFVSEVCDALEIANPNVYGVSIVAEVSTAVVVTLSCRATVEQSSRIVALLKEHVAAIKCEVDEPVIVPRG